MKQKGELGVLPALGAILAFLGVATGAFGVHALRGSISIQAMDIFRTGVLYQLVHSIGILAVAGLPVNYIQPKYIRFTGWLFVAGVTLFSGSLYVLAVTGSNWWGAVTPVGGLCFLVGWGALAFGLIKERA